MRTLQLCFSVFWASLAVFWAMQLQYNKAAYFMALAIYVDPK